MFVRDNKTFEVFIDDECVGVLNVTPVEMFELTGIIGAPWYKFRRGAVGNIRHSEFGNEIAMPSPAGVTVSNCLQDKINEFCKSLDFQSCSNPSYARLYEMSEVSVIWTCFNNLLKKGYQINCSL